MTTDEQIQSFVDQNRDLVIRMMSIQKDTLDKTVTVGRSMAKDTFENTREVAGIARRRGAEFFGATAAMFTSPTVQRHFINASMEFVAGLTAMAELAPVPDYMKTAATDFEKNFKQAACRANEHCPAKKVMIEADETSVE